MNKTVEKIFLSRQDLSDFVFHFTKGAKARNTLEQIILDGAIKDIKSRGFICFTETPILMLPDMFDIFAEYPKPMYAPYGIGIRRDTLYELGGRPVIYGTDEDKMCLSESLLWRFEELKPGKHDYSWLREWRLQQKEYKLKKDDIVVVNALKDEVELFYDLLYLNVDGEPADGGFEYYYTGECKRVYKGISMERIRNMNLDTKDKLRKDISEQDFTVELIPLGTEWR